MAAIRSRVVISLTVLGLIFLAACGIELNDRTPGAAGRCEPSTAEVSDFHTNVFTPDVSTNCVSCHQQGTVSPNGFKFVDPATLTTPSAQYNNYCYFFRFGRIVVDFPLSPQHTSFIVTPATIPNLINWVNSVHPD